MKSSLPARIHLLPAMEAPVVVVIRRKPSKCFHIVRWNTKTDVLEYGSWFHGKLYSQRCDVSFDGRWMVYLAMGAHGSTWNGVCQLPFLKTSLTGGNLGSWNGGGIWSDRRTLLLNQWLSADGRVPFRLGTLTPEYGGEDLSVLYARLARDGFARVSENWGTEHVEKKANKHRVVQVGDDGWRKRPSRQHPWLTIRYVGYLKHGYSHTFELEGYPDLLNAASWACWDSLGQLVFAQQGSIARYTLADIARRQASFYLDLESLQRPYLAEDHQT